MNFDISQVVMTIVVLCLFLWRMSYGANNGLFAEAAGLIAVLGSFAAVYYLMNIAGSVLSKNLGAIIPKIGYLVVAFTVYKVMTSIGEAFKKVKNVPIVGKFDRFMGAIIGIFEAACIIYLVEFITDIEIVKPVLGVGIQLFCGIQSYLRSFYK